MDENSGCDIVYAIAFDIDTKKADAAYSPSAYQIIYRNIETTLERHHFSKKQGSVYFGDETVKMRDCHNAIRDLVETVKGFKDSVDNLQMLQILEDSDLEYMLDWFEYKGR